MPTNSIAIVGNLNIDIRTSPFGADDHLFRDGETSVSEIHETVGGGAANVAVAARRMGAEVFLCTAVGDDPAGERLERHIRKIGIHARIIRKTTPTGRSINLNWTNHNRHFVSSLPSSRELQVSDIDVAALYASGCRQLYRGDIWFAEGMLPGGNTSIMKEARDCGMTTHIDINWDPLWSTSCSHDACAKRREWVRSTLHHVSFAHANERELIQFSGAQDIDGGVDFMLEAGVETVILHRGREGCAAATASREWVEAPSQPVAQPVCETGAGDVFSAAFMVRPHLPLSQRLAESNAVAACYLRGEFPVFERL